MYLFICETLVRIMKQTLINKCEKKEIHLKRNELLIKMGK